MGEKLVIGPINKGLKTDRTPFNIDNDAFPKLVNAYQWRGRIKRKRGNQLLCRLQRRVAVNITLTTNAGQTGQLLNFPVVPGTINLVGSVDGTTYTDPALNGTLLATGGTGTGGTINYATGSITINAGAGENLVGTISYFPLLPVMGLEDLELESTQFPGLLAFDTQFSYEIPTTLPNTPVDVSFYKNPGLSASLPGYVPKATNTAFTWNGENYQQFWTTNYQGALWATNGIEVPFTVTNIGMQFKPLTLVTGVITGPPARADITVIAHGLVVGDFVFINEVVGNIGINLQTGYVTAILDANTIQVTFPEATITGGYLSGGIVQYLTNTADPVKDCIRWYDGNPTLAGGIKGWVNYCPPLSLRAYSIAQLPPAIYYLVGARMIVPFKDRLLFFGPVVQTSAAGSQKYLQDTVIYSQNGTPYYTVSFTDNTTNYGINPTINYSQILVPDNQTATPFSYFSDNTGFGGFKSVGVDKPITTVSSNEDSLIVGLSTIQTRFVYTGNDIVPFDFYLINSELGSASTFSIVNFDEGVVTRGTRGYIITNQTSTKRFDIDILDQVFEIRLKDNGNERFCSQRDFQNEWAVFTYLSNNSNTPENVFPNQTLQYNYREKTWGIFNETYTTYGQFRRQSGETWLTIKERWNTWNEPWQDGESTLFQPDIVAGNQQGFVMVKDEGTGEDTSLFIQSIAGNVITSPNHGLANGDYILIEGALGTIGSQINGKIFSINSATQNTFVLNPTINAGTYTGGGLITRFYVPFIQSKQFPPSWGMGRKTRLGVQQYLLTTTTVGQVQLLIFLSQDDNTGFNDNVSIPILDTIYSTQLYTCPESTNLGLTPANINLQMPFSKSQGQTWHRINTSLLGDSVQFAITMSDAQMRQFFPTNQTSTITGITLGYPTILQSINTLGTGSMVQISGVVGTTQLNNNPLLPNPVYEIISTTGTTITLNVDSTAFSAYVSGGTVTVMTMPNQETEIEFHGAILDINPSQLLS